MLSSARPDGGLDQGARTQTESTPEFSQGPLRPRGAVDFINPLSFQRWFLDPPTRMAASVSPQAAQPLTLCHDIKRVELVEVQ